MKGSKYTSIEEDKYPPYFSLNALKPPEIERFNRMQSRKFYSRTILRGAALGTAGTAVAVPEFLRISHNLVGFGRLIPFRR